MQLTTEQIEFLRTQWSIRGEPRFHRRVANYVYFTNIGESEVVLRLTEPSHRSINEIESELDWLSYLAINGMQIAGPIATNAGLFVVEIPGDKTYYAAIFEKAKGSFFNGDLAPTDDLIVSWGEYLGKMHQLTKKYLPPKHIQQRQKWEKDESLVMALRSHDKEDQLPYKRLNELMEWMRSLPRDKDCYGLTHCDLHRGNFFVHEGKITAFDFDDSCYQWFSYDMVAPLNSIDKNCLEGERSFLKEKALESFLLGYGRNNILDPIWIERIHIFDKYRAALMYHWIKTCIKENVFDANGLIWAKERLPKLVEAIQEPLKLL